MATRATNSRATNCTQEESSLFIPRSVLTSFSCVSFLRRLISLHATDAKGSDTDNVLVTAHRGLTLTLVALLLVALAAMTVRATESGDQISKRSIYSLGYGSYGGYGPYYSGYGLSSSYYGLDPGYNALGGYGYVGGYGYPYGHIGGYRGYGGYAW
uniref:Uncharacterized protein n=1 Tax=Timema bartmani TaxID=61472 RepID=A0A7R9F9P0_9NEOP|nr:unnamed protein product [Timema bartmani]